MGALVASLAVHLAVGALVLGFRADPPGLATETNPVVLVELFEPPPPPPAPAPAPTPDPAPSEPAPAEAPAAPAQLAAAPVEAKPVPTRRPSPQPVPPQIPTVPVSGAPTPAPALTLIGGGALAGARTAGGGGSGAGAGGGQGDGAGGGRCDMLARLQAAVREDPEVRAAITQAHTGASAGSRAILVWDGDWLQSPGQLGKGLAGVRQAISVEVAFAPAACRTERLRGLALISLADGPGAPRLALGAGSWSWDDLVSRRR